LPPVGKFPATHYFGITGHQAGLSLLSDIVGCHILGYYNERGSQTSLLAETRLSDGMFYRKLHRRNPIMSFGIVVMSIIIALTALVVVVLFIYGIKHDPHTDIRRPESSRAVQILQQQQVAAARKLPHGDGASLADESTGQSETEIQSQPETEAAGS
jgi:hypothetical protein